MQIVGQFPPGRLPPVHFQPRTFPTLDSSQPLAYREGGGGGTTHFWPPPLTIRYNTIYRPQAAIWYTGIPWGGATHFWPPRLLDPSFVTQCEIRVGHRYTVHVCARSGSEFLDPSSVTQCMCALAWVCLAWSVLNYWILAPLHNVRFRWVIVSQCMCALAMAASSLAAFGRSVQNYWILALMHRLWCMGAMSKNSQKAAHNELLNSNFILIQNPSGRSEKIGLNRK